MCMKRVFLLFCLFIVLISYQLSGQDLHYSQFFNTPLNISPGLAGNFNGDHRLGVNLRQQWKSIPVNYQSFDVAYDYKDGFKFRDNHFNLGFIFNYDSAGDLGLQHIGASAMASYSLRLSKGLHLKPGISLGFVQRRFDTANATTANQWDGREFDPNIAAELIGNDNLTYLNAAAGASLRYRKGERSFLDIGLSAYNLTSPSQSFNDNASYLANLEPRFNVFAMANWRIARKLDLLLNGIIQAQKPHQETLVNGQVKLYFDKDYSKAIYLGVGMRFDDAWYPMVAIEVDGIYGSLSYDFNISDFDIASDGNGGPELAFRYVIAKVPFYPKKPCPIY